MIDLTTTSKINRLNEFFDFKELDWFLANCRDKILDEAPAIDFLYAQTVYNYVTGVNTEPEIDNLLLEYLHHKQII